MPALLRSDSSFAPSGSWVVPSTHAEATGSYRTASSPIRMRAAAVSRKVCNTMWTDVTAVGRTLWLIFRHLAVDRGERPDALRVLPPSPLERGPHRRHA